MNSALKLLAVAVVALLAGFLGAWGFSATSLGERATERHLLSNPGILPKLAEAYQAQAGAELVGDLREPLETPFAGAVLGNPQGKRVLVEFLDYQCGYCRQATGEIDAMLAADPELKVVVREWPIFPGSEQAARLALAAAEQGKYRAFHDAMFAADAVDEAALGAAMEKAGIDAGRARRVAASNEVTAELAKNNELAGQLELEGTPGWVAGGNIIYGYVPRARLEEALDAASDG